MTLPLAFAGLDPLTSVGLVLLLLFVGLSWLARRGPSGLPVGTRRERSFTLTGQHAVHVIEVGGARLLVGTGPSGAPRLLAELGPVEAAGEVASSKVEEGGALLCWLRGLAERFGLAPAPSLGEQLGPQLREQALSTLAVGGRGPRGR